MRYVLAKSIEKRIFFLLKGEILNKYKEKFKILEDIRKFQAISDFFPCGIIKIGIEKILTGA